MISITHVGERLWYAFTKAVLTHEQVAQPFPEFAYRYYAGHLTHDEFDAIVAWLHENGTGRIIHNFDANEVDRRTRVLGRGGKSSKWYTMFAMTDVRTAVAFKLRWAKTWSS